MLDVAARCLVHIDGKEEPLTAMEFDLLYVFSQNPHRVLSRDRLLNLAHHRDNEPFDRSIDIRITRIRRKIEVDPAKPQVIKTIRGAGYIYVPPKAPHETGMTSSPIDMAKHRARGSRARRAAAGLGRQRGLVGGDRRLGARLHHRDRRGGCVIEFNPAAEATFGYKRAADARQARSAT